MDGASACLIYNYSMKINRVLALVFAFFLFACQPTTPLAVTIIDQDKVITRNLGLARTITATLEPMGQHPRVSHARSIGMIWAWDVETSLPDFSQRYHRNALKHGVLLRPIGKTIYIMPPYVINKNDAELLARGALAALDETLAQE